MLRAAITAMRSSPTTLPLSRISRILAVQELGGIEQIGALLDRAGDVVLLLEDTHADSRLIVAHACSIDFSRPIMASTRARTCSFFCSKAGALGGQRLLPLPQRPVLLLDLAHR